MGLEVGGAMMMTVVRSWGGVIDRVRGRRKRRKKSRRRVSRKRAEGARKETRRRKKRKRRKRMGLSMSTRRKRKRRRRSDRLDVGMTKSCSRWVCSWQIYWLKERKAVLNPMLSSQQPMVHAVIEGRRKGGSEKGGRRRRSRRLKRSHTRKMGASCRAYSASRRSEALLCAQVLG
jgi:hypothetical protein